MALTDTFLRRPVLAIVVNVVIVVAGLRAVTTINTRQYPKVVSATVTIRTAYVGASAELVRGFITTPLERVISEADGIDYIESQSLQGVSIINARLKLDFDTAAALADISTRVDQVRADLPPEAEIPAISTQPSDAAIAAMYLSFSSPVLADNQVTDYLLRVAQPRLSALDGVQRAEILGARTFALRAWLKPDRMAALDISPAQVRQALAANNSLAAVGQTKGALVQVNLSATTDLRTVDDFKQLVIRERNGALVRLSDIADVVLGADDYDQDVRVSGEHAVFMGIWVRPDASSLDVLKRVRGELDQLQHELPAGMQARIAFDSSAYIDDAMTDVVKTLADTVAIVMIVIFLFLGSLRTVAVPVVAIPVSLIGAVFLMQAFGFSMNLLTLLAIVLSVGLVVDDAIVVIENIERHVRTGKTRMRAAVDGARELVGPIIAMTITLAAAFVPIGFQGGLTGALFREFAFTLAGAVFISGVVALTLSPVMSAHVLRADHRRGWFGRRVDRGFDAVRNGYGRALDATLRYRPGVYAVWIVLSLLIVPMYVLAPKELAPNEDQGVVFGAIETPANASLDQIVTYTEQVDRIYRSVPEAAQTFQVTFPNSGFGGMLTTPWTQRSRTIFTIQSELNRKLAGITGIRAPAFLPAALPNPGLLPVEFVIASTADYDDLLRFADQLVQRAAQSGQFAFPPFLDVKIDQANAEIVVDRDQVAAMGQTLQQLGADLSAILGGNYVNRFDFAGRSYKVIPQIERMARLTPDQLANIWVSGPAGHLVPLAAIARIRAGVEPRSLNRMQQLNAIKISGVATRSVDQALRVLEDEAATILPPGYRIDYTGESRQLRQESGKFLPAIGLALLLIFLVLAAQFNSFRDPFVILAGSVPLAMFGALIFAFLKFQGPPDLHFRLTQGWTTTLNIYSQVGLVTLAGLVAKNGILIVQFANAQQQLGATKLEAVRAAALTRLRPILMVTAATVAGHFPLTLVSGPGAAARNSIGIVLVGGMSIGTLFTLFVVPSLYMLIARDHRRDRARLGTLSES
jgi:multidrug efflux pump